MLLPGWQDVLYLGHKVGRSSTLSTDCTNMEYSSHTYNRVTTTSAVLFRTVTRGIAGRRLATDHASQRLRPPSMLFVLGITMWVGGIALPLPGSVPAAAPHLLQSDTTTPGGIARDVIVLFGTLALARAHDPWG